MGGLPADSAEERPCWGLLNSKERRNAERLMQSLVIIRNDGVEGHGIPGENDFSAESDAISYLIEQFSPIIPKIDSTGDNFNITLPNNEVYLIKTLKPQQGNLICYRSIKKTKVGLCIIKAQIERELSLILS